MSNETLDWRRLASCRDADTDLFFAPESDENGRAPKAVKQEREQIAKAFCAGCPSLLECLNDAVKSHDRYAIRGGMTPDERREQFGAKCTECPRFYWPQGSQVTCGPTCAKRRHQRQKNESQHRRKAVAV